MKSVIRMVIFCFVYWGMCAAMWPLDTSRYIAAACCGLGLYFIGLSFGGDIKD